MLSLFAATVAGGGVAQAQDCIARAKNTGMARAEGITEVVADIELRCGRPEANRFGFVADIPCDTGNRCRAEHQHHQRD